MWPQGDIVSEEEEESNDEEQEQQNVESNGEILKQERNVQKLGRWVNQELICEDSDTIASTLLPAPLGERDRRIPRSSGPANLAHCEQRLEPATKAVL